MYNIYAGTVADPESNDQGGRARFGRPPVLYIQDHEQSEENF